VCPVPTGHTGKATKSKAELWSTGSVSRSYGTHGYTSQEFPASLLMVGATALQSRVVLGLCLSGLSRLVKGDDWLGC